MTDQEHFEIKGDRALSSGDTDKLGFRQVSRRIAASLVDRASQDGFVVGIEGAWGSGKSSLLFLIGDELRKLPSTRRPSIINFRPWLIGSRDALITGLFSDLSSELEKFALEAGDATPLYKSKAQEASKALRSFMNGLSRTGAAIEVVGEASGWGPAKLIGKSVRAIGDITRGESASPQLSELKDKLVKSLRELDHRFIVTIDDVDRLEPAEVIEILRLVRSVVDLPNVIYILCYDSEILAQSIERAAGVKSGKAYLEKIVQLTAMVPQPEPFQLRQWFTDELHQIASVKDDDELSRLRAVIDHEGGRQLLTPRSVIRALDAIRFFWPALRDIRADLADLVWLQIIKDGNPALYRWIEAYCATFSAISVGAARIEEAEKSKELSALFEAVPEGHFNDMMYRYYFAEQLPGVEVDYAEEGRGFSIFQHVSEHERDLAVRAGRLSSPDHYRLYFALAAPSHALTNDEFATIWEASNAGPQQTSDSLLELHSAAQSGSLTKADVLLERLKGQVYEDLSAKQCENFLTAFSNMMDEAYRIRPFDHFWINSFWERAERLVPFFISNLEDDDRKRVLRLMFEHGDAIGWLTSMFRRETFAHGRYGERPKPEEEWLFQEDELDEINAILLERYRSMSFQDVISSPKPVSLLFAWMQGGDKEGPCNLIAGHAESDAGFLDALEGLTSWINSSDRGRFKVLKRENLESFMDLDGTTARLQGLVDDPQLGERARRIVEVLKLGNEY
ncbi:MAG: KAP family P-loop domain [Rhodobacteraceae bacterium HLUCCA12]|nr:MAG: KAP family P-loop domain [Rhodobacteraceae bacterium HLUCCA12]